MWSEYVCRPPWSAGVRRGEGPPDCQARDAGNMPPAWVRRAANGADMTHAGRFGKVPGGYGP